MSKFFGERNWVWWWEKEGKEWVMDFGVNLKVGLGFGKENIGLWGEILEKMSFKGNFGKK